MGIFKKIFKKKKEQILWTVRRNCSENDVVDAWIRDKNDNYIPIDLLMIKRYTKFLCKA